MKPPKIASNHTLEIDQFTKKGKVEGLSKRLESATTFNLIALDLTGDGTFKTKQYYATHISEGKDIFENAVKVRSPNAKKSDMILVANGRLVDYTGDDVKSPEIQSLIGKAIELRLIPFGGLQNNEGIVMAYQNMSKRDNQSFLTQINGEIEEQPIIDEKDGVKKFKDYC